MTMRPETRVDWDEVSRRHRDCDRHLEKIAAEIERLQAKAQNWAAYRSGTRKKRPRCSCALCVANGIASTPGFGFDLLD